MWAAEGEGIQRNLFWSRENDELTWFSHVCLSACLHANWSHGFWKFLTILDIQAVAVILHLCDYFSGPTRSDQNSVNTNFLPVFRFWIINLSKKHRSFAFHTHVCKEILPLKIIKIGALYQIYSHIPVFFGVKLYICVCT